jgi:Carbohydrate esterase, sialic acid-specific acetylesterase
VIQLQLGQLWVLLRMVRFGPIGFMAAICGVLLCLWMGAVHAAEADLIIVAGQSNAVGYDAKPEVLKEDEADKQVLFWYRCGDPLPDEFDSTSGGKWTTLGPQPLGKPDRTPGNPRQYGNFAQPEGGFGPEMGLGRKLTPTAGRRLAIVKGAWSGTGLATDWDPEATDDRGACYRALVAEVQLATSAAAQQDLTLKPRALVWVQGESDANPADGPLYGDRLVKMISALRNELAAPEMAALLAINTRFRAMGDQPHSDVLLVIEGQKAAASKLGRSRYVDTDGVGYFGPYHFDGAGTLEVGYRMAKGLEEIEAEGNRAE